MNYGIDELIAFVAVVELNSFSEAARKLHITQPALSRRIAKIEEEVGEQLLIRSKKNIQPTVLGRRFFAVAKRLVVEFQSASAELRNIRQDGTGRVAISINMTWCSVIVPEVTAYFRDHFPGFSLNFFEGSSAYAVKKVYDGDVDFGITHKPKRLFGVEFEPLLTEEFIVACHRDHPLAGLVTVPLSELKKHVWMRLLKDELFSSLDWIEFEGAAEFPATLIHANHYSTLLRLVEHNLGVTILPRMAINQHTGENIVLRPFVEPFMRRTVGILRKQGRELSPAAENLMQHAREAFRLRLQRQREAG